LRNVDLEVITMQTQTKIPEPPGLEAERRQAPTERGRAYGYAVAALGAIWLAVVLMSVFAPDLVSGTQQDRFPLAAVVAPLAGLAATKSVVKAFSRMTEGTGSWPVYLAAVAGIWLTVALVSIYSPVTVSGTDPTKIPIAALVAPIAGSILTGALTELFVATKPEPR
jgi:hypothetical protein